MKKLPAVILLGVLATAGSVVSQEAPVFAVNYNIVYIPNSGHYGLGGVQQLQSTTTSYGFRTKGQATPDSVWYFFVEAPVEPPAQPAPPPPPEALKICRFYQLAPYLDELKVEDITTALETAWKSSVKNPRPI